MDPRRLQINTGLIALALASTGSYAQQANVTTWPGLPSEIQTPNSTAVGINSAGHLLGLTNLYGFDPGSGISYPGVTHSWLGTAPASVLDLGVLGVEPPPFEFPQPETFATRLNSLDQAAAWGTDTAAFGAVYAALWLPQPAFGAPAGLFRLPSLQGSTIDRAFGLNTLGQLVGESRDSSGNIRPVMWTLAAGQATMIDLAPGLGPNGRGFAINDLGQAVGQVNEPNGEPFNNYFQSFLYLPQPAYGLPAGATVLQAPGVETALNFGFPNDINQSGQIFGRTAGFSWRPALWLPEPALGLPAGVTLFNSQVFPDEVFLERPWVGLDYAEFTAVNSSGVAVGEAGLLREIQFPRPRLITESRAFIWRNGRFDLIDDLMPLNTPWQRIYTAAGITDAGQIAATAVDASGNTFAVTITLDAPPCPSGFRRQPSPVTICEGGDAAFSVWAAAGGGGDLAFQWRRNGAPVSDGPTPGGSLISGSGTLQLTITAATPADAGDYDVVITNSCGAVTSATASLTVNPGLQVTSPADARICFGGGADFVVSASDPGAAFFWEAEDPSAPGSWIPLFDGPVIIGDIGFDAAGTQTGTLTVSNAGAAVSGESLHLHGGAQNDCGFAVSDPATLTIGGACAADYDCDGSVQPADIAAFVNTWFASLTQGTLAGDFDRNGAVEPADVAVFVSAWFAAVEAGGC